MGTALTSSVGLALLVLAACGSSETAEDDASCRNTDENPLHCGACGHSCYGGACKGGICGPAGFYSAGVGANEVAGKDDTLVAAGSGGVAAAFLDTYLPTIKGEISAPDARVSTNPAEHAAAAQGFAYWAEDDGIHRCPVLGCLPTPPMVPKDADTPSFISTLLAAHNDLLVFAPPAPKPAAPRSIKTCKADGCSNPQTIYTSEPNISFLHMETDGTYLAFVENNALRVCALADCAASVKTVTNALTNVQLNANFPVDRPFSLGEGHLAYNYDGKVFACTLPSCQPIDMFDGPAFGFSFHGGVLYATKDDQIWQCKIGGCDRKPEALFGGYRIPVITSIFVSERFIGFWADHGGTFSKWAR